MTDAIKGLHICFAPPTQHLTDARGKRWAYEVHAYFGPIVLTGHGDPSKTQPSENSPFWDAFEKKHGTGDAFVAMPTPEAPRD